MKKAYDTRYSQAVTHLSTNRALRCLTSVIGREPVFSTWYGRRHSYASRNRICMSRVGNNRQKNHLKFSHRKNEESLRHSVFPSGHPSTNRALRCLTSGIGREPVFSTWYGRRHSHVSRNRICMSRVGNNRQKNHLKFSHRKNE